MAENTARDPSTGRFLAGHRFSVGNAGGGRPPGEFRARCRDFMDEEGWDLLAEIVRGGQGDLRVQLEALKFIARMGADFREDGAKPTVGVNIPAWRSIDSP